jgi:hypothetical protein
MNKKVVLFEIIRIEESDRLLAITRDDSGVLTGLNFFQGIDSPIDVFKVGESEDALLQFVKKGLELFEKNDQDIQFIDKLCWMHLDNKLFQFNLHKNDN